MVSSIIFIGCFFVFRVYSTSQEIKFYKKIETNIPYDPDVENIFWDFSDSKDLIFTSPALNNQALKELKIVHKKLEDDKFHKEYILHYDLLGIEKLYITDLAYNYKDQVIALILQRGIVFYEINTQEVRYLASNVDTSFTEVYYHSSSNSFIAHSLYFYHPDDVSKPEKLYQIRYNPNQNDIVIKAKIISYPFLPYSILVNKLMDVDSLIVLSHVLDNSLSVYNVDFENVVQKQFSKGYPPFYQPDSMQYYRYQGPQRFFLKLKKYDYNIERIEKVFTFKDYIIATIKPLHTIDFSKREVVILKYDGANKDLLIKHRFYVIYNKKHNWFNFYNFTTDQKIRLRSNYIIQSFIDLNELFVVKGNTYKIKKYKSIIRKIYNLENETPYYYSFYISEILL